MDDQGAGVPIPAEWISTMQAARILGVTPVRVWQMVAREGTLPGRRVVDRWLVWGPALEAHKVTDNRPRVGRPRKHAGDA
jgi:hypothetical protein